jgi:isoquinoline 1-oxidoreductase alpha subunit
MLSAVEGKEITTIEGLAEIDEEGQTILHPVQQAFLDEQAPQCSWCMSGQMMAAAALLEANPNPDPQEIRNGMNAIYCRCGAYHRIRKAVARAAVLTADSGSQSS